jgi:hypothetical protein
MSLIQSRPLEQVIRPWVDVLAQLPPPPAAALPQLPDYVIKWGERSAFSQFEQTFEDYGSNAVSIRAQDRLGGPPNVRDITYDFTEISELRSWHGEKIKHSDLPGQFATIPVIDKVVFSGPDLTGELAAEDKGSTFVRDPLTGEERRPEVRYVFRTPSHFAKRNLDYISPLSPWQAPAGEIVV